MRIYVPDRSGAHGMSESSFVRPTHLVIFRIIVPIRIQSICIKRFSMSELARGRFSVDRLLYILYLLLFIYFPSTTNDNSAPLPAQNSTPCSNDKTSLSTVCIVPLQYFVQSRMISHHRRFGMARRGVFATNVRWVTFFLIRLVVYLTINSYRPTGFHGESGRAHSGGHITVQFRTRNRHYTTHHVYLSDEGYEGRYGCGGGGRFAGRGRNNGRGGHRKWS